jgi:hypothetical protein
VTSTAAATPTSTSSGAAYRGDTRTVLNDSVGSLLTISPAISSVQKPITSG